MLHKALTARYHMNMSATSRVFEITSPSFYSEHGRTLPRLTWGFFLLAFVAALLAAFGATAGTAFIGLSVVLLLAAWRFPYAVFYISLATAPLIGWMVSISTGRLQFGERAFGGAIDVSIGELLALAVLASWGIRLLTVWRHAPDRAWKPWLPLVGVYGFLALAHVLSVFSSADPDPVRAVKYALRPVFLSYVLFVLLPANFIRSMRRFIHAAAILVAVGSVFALDGLRSMFQFSGDEPALHRAHPLPILGFSPIGDNHNLLAELLVFTAPLALALAVFIRDTRRKRLAQCAAAFMGLVALFTFARSAWIALALQAVFLGMTIWRKHPPVVGRRARTLLMLFAIPLVIAMAVFSISPDVKSSTSARVALTSMAWHLASEHPLFGVGAGEFTNQLVRIRAFSIDFGDPIDAHGIFQKIGAETGLFGLFAFALLLIRVVQWMRHFWRRVQPWKDEREAFAFLAAAIIGTFAYQLFNTTYWSAKLWLPLGIALAAGNAFTSFSPKRDPDFLLPRP